MEYTAREQAERRWSALCNERSSWMSHWQDISTFILPRNGRYFHTDRNKGDKRQNNIYDSTGTRSLRVLAAGMMAGMTSPARPWFRLQTPDKELNKYAPVKTWLSDVTKLMLDVFAKSNTYRALHTTYEELGAFGTGCKVLIDDYENVVHHYPLTVGEYCLATDYKGNVNTLFREFEKSVGELVAEFGYNACSQTVKNLYDRHNLDSPVVILHAIEPRTSRDPRLKDAGNMAWKSCYYERGAESGKVLRESGFKRFRAIASRWATTSGDVYGNSPGMESLGDIKQLQHQQLRKGQAIDFMSNPPLQVPTSLRNQQVERMPGGVTYYDGAGGPQSGIRSMFEVSLDLSHLREDIVDVRERIRSAFYSDMFLMLASQTNTQMTATEVAERHEEKMLMLGPTVERLHNEELSPLIEMTFDRMIEAGIVPPPPEEMQGQELNVEFVSMLAQAQRAIATNGVDRFVGNLGVVAGMKPEVLDKLNADVWADKYGDMLGVDPELIVAGEQVALIRQQRAELQQAAAQQAMANQAADTAQKLANAPTTGGNALTDVTRAFSGYT